MTIRMKLFATLGKYLPAARIAHHEADVEAPDGATVAEILNRLGVPEEEVHLVLLNGRHVDKNDLDATALSAGDTLAVWPPVAGG